ncbi:hypothetical protein ACEUZ9_004687 [Paracoccus litorisediminis]|uniref:hypothetical protein n=1 Tax=Paracoccus litorisediminis TaxID=2006130 RepID=UPI00372FBA99
MEWRNCLAMASFIAVLAMPAMGAPQRPEALDLIMPDGLDETIGKVSQGDKSVLISRLDIGSRGFKIIIEGLVLSPIAEGTLLRFEKARLLPVDPGDGGFLVTGGSIRFGKRVEINNACGWLSAIDAMKLDRGVIAPIDLEPERPNQKKIAAPAWRMEFTGLDYSKAGAPICGVSGKMSLVNARVTSPGGKTFEADNIGAEAIVPFLPAAPDAPEMSALRLRASEINYSHQKEIPALGIGGLSISLDAKSASLDGAARVLASKHPFLEDIDAGYLALQLYNAATMVEARLKADAPIMRIYTAGVVPARAVANFSRVGLTTINGRSSIDLELDRGDVKLLSEIDMTGIAKINLDLHSVIMPYGPEVFATAARGEPMGFSALPDWRLIHAKFTTVDEGFDRAVHSLSGLPAWRYLDEIGKVLLAERSGVSRTIGETVKTGLAEFLRDASAGKPVVLEMHPQKVVPLAEIIVMAIRDFATIAVFLGVDRSIVVQTEVP